MDNVKDAIAPNSRWGKARTGRGGYADSLKLGCVTPSGSAPCSVNSYQSNRLDGFMDVLLSDGVTLSNITANFDSSFTYSQWSEAIRWPGSSSANPPFDFKNMTWTNVNLTDTAASTGVVPNPYGYPVPPVGNFDNKKRGDHVRRQQPAHSSPILETVEEHKTRTAALAVGCRPFLPKGVSNNGSDAAERPGQMEKSRVPAL